MKVELTSEQVKQLEPMLQRCRWPAAANVLAGQILPGDWQEGPEKVFLHYAIIRPETAMKIRRLIQKERDLERDHSNLTPSQK